MILRPGDYDLWLEAGVRGAEPLRPLLRPYAHEEMSTYTVSTLVNNPADEGPRCAVPLRVCRAGV